MDTHLRIDLGKPHDLRGRLIVYAAVETPFNLDRPAPQEAAYFATKWGSEIHLLFKKEIPKKREYHVHQCDPHDQRLLLCDPQVDDGMEADISFIGPARNIPEAHERAYALIDTYFKDFSVQRDPNSKKGPTPFCKWPQVSVSSIDTAILNIKDLAYRHIHYPLPGCPQMFAQTLAEGFYAPFDEEVKSTVQEWYYFMVALGTMPLSIFEKYAARFNLATHLYKSIREEDFLRSEALIQELRKVKLQINQDPLIKALKPYAERALNPVTRVRDTAEWEKTI